MEPLQTEVTQLQKDIAILTPTYSSERKTKVAELNARLDQIQPLLTLYQQIYTNLVVLGTTGKTSANDNTTATRLQSTLSLYQSIYLNLINTREAIRLARLQNTQSIDQVEAATVPMGPISPRPLNNALLAGVVGLMLAAGIVFLVEYLDDTIKTPEDVERLLELPLIGYIAEMQSTGKEEAEVYVSRQPRSPVSEAFRSLRTNLEFSSVDKPLRTILVTGAEAGDGKTTIAANLAAIFAQGGKRVLLMDCDLRRPRVHRFLGIQNRVGLTDLFRDSLGVEAVTYQWSDSNSKSMSVITSGSLPPNPAELLGSQKMDSILADLTARVDVIIIDSPPSLVSDAQILAAKVDGVLLVVQPGKTHAGAARAMREQLARAGARVVGAVFNRIPRSHGYYYGGYRYYSPYYYQNDKYLNGNDPAPALSPAVVAPGEKPPQASLLSRLWKRQNQSDK
jgi:capsular exopolysaccharide synthesis family protein